MFMFIYFVKWEQKKQKQSVNGKVDDRVYVRNSKLVKSADLSQQWSQRHQPQHWRCCLNSLPKRNLNVKVLKLTGRLFHSKASWIRVVIIAAFQVFFQEWSYFHTFFKSFILLMLVLFTRTTNQTVCWDTSSFHKIA